MLDKVRSNWHAFAYNFQWGDYGYVFIGVLPRISILIPLFGYLALFNDGVLQRLEFDYLTAGSTGLLPNSLRVRLTYFGLVSLGIGAAIYYWRRPYVVRLGADFWEYRRRMMEIASPSMFIQMHGHIRQEDRDPYTQGGKYYDSEYEDFLKLATGSEQGGRIEEAYETRDAAIWPDALQRYEPLLTGMLEETYFREGRKRRFELGAALFLAGLGYLMMLIPSVELFVRVLVATFSGGDGT